MLSLHSLLAPGFRDQQERLGSCSLQMHRVFTEEVVHYQAADIEAFEVQRAADETLCSQYIG